jgi:hypothetical protein
MPPAGGRLSAWLPATLRRSPAAMPVAAPPPFFCGGQAAWEENRFGAQCCLALDDVLAARLLSSWQAGRPSLQLPAKPRTAV